MAFPVLAANHWSDKGSAAASSQVHSREVITAQLNHVVVDTDGAYAAGLRCVGVQQYLRLRRHGS